MRDEILVLPRPIKPIRIQLCVPGRVLNSAALLPAGGNKSLRSADACPLYKNYGGALVADGGVEIDPHPPLSVPYEVAVLFKNI